MHKKPRRESPEKRRRGMLVMVNYLQTRKPQDPLLKLMRTYTQLINRAESKIKTHFTDSTQRKLETFFNSRS